MLREPFRTGEVCESNSAKRANMTLNDLLITPTPHTPQVSFSPNGEMLIRGRSIPEDGGLFYEDLMDWVEAYKQNPAINTVFVIDMEYLNDISTKYILMIIRDLNNVCDHFLVKWIYESDDADMLELGQLMSSSSGCSFEYIEKLV